MARTRYLRPGFFKNETLASLTPYHRLLFAGLWLIADRAGRLEDRPRRIKAELFPYDDLTVEAVNRMLDDLTEGDGFIERYEAGGVRIIQIRKWSEHQRPHSNEARSCFESRPKTEKTLENLSIPTKVEKPGRYNYNFNSNFNSNLDSNLDPDVPPAWTTGARPAPLIPSPLAHGKCYPSTACARGLCIPRFLGQQWRDQSDDAVQVQAFIEAALQTVTGPVGDDPLTWWREQWRQAHGSSVATTKGLRTVAAGKRLQAALDAGAELDPFGTKAIEQERKLIGGEA